MCCKSCGSNSCSGFGKGSGAGGVNAGPKGDPGKDAIVPIGGIIMIDGTETPYFDIGGTGLGSGKWENWAICDGNNGTPNLTDRFIVGAGNTYAVGDTGGAASVTLATTELPAHNHAVTDPGHSHAVTDPGHNHGTNENPHTHAVTDPGHTHGATLDNAGSHTHAITINEGDFARDGLTGHNTGNAAAEFGFGGATATAAAAGSHTHDTEITSNTTGVTVAQDTTDLTVNSNTTGLTVASATTGLTTQNTGGAQAHENRPPYYSLFFIKKIA